VGVWGRIIKKETTFVGGASPKKWTGVARGRPNTELKVTFGTSPTARAIKGERCKGPHFNREAQREVGLDKERNPGKDNMRVSTWGGG